MSQARLNFRGVSALLVDRNNYCRSLVSQMLRGFGLPTIHSCGNGEEAKKLLKETYIDMCLIEAELPDMSGSDLIRWIRQEQKEPLRFVPILVLSGYTQMRMLSQSRDSGANLVLKKPLSAQALFDRIAWLARTPRAYIEAGSYVGPDRRFREVTPPDGQYKRDTDEQPAQPPLESTIADEIRTSP
jgi:CheY-like chemotaxis protein